MNTVLSLYLRHLLGFGNLTVTDASGNVSRWGNGEGEPIHLRFNSRAAEWAVALNPSLKFGECYMNGGFDLLEGSIYDILKLVMENAGADAASEPWMRAISRTRLLYRRYVQNNTPSRARRNVQHHYDLSSEFYELFLDKDRQYSCAYFETPDATLDEAQLAKKRHIAAKLLMDREGLRTLDIGSGWGGLGLYLADRCKARVTGLTLSEEQFKLSNQRAKAAGLDERVDFQLLDYRKAEGPFDRIVSVGMFEHVGPDFFDEFFRQSTRLLHRDGVMLLHTIGRLDEPANTNAFIGKYIFPGGYIPALSEIMTSVERSGLMFTDVEVLRLHYAQTCRHWRLRFDERRQEAKAIYDERFCRMWEFYLAASECSFRWQDLVVFQIQLTRKRETLPLTREYMVAEEAELRRMDSPAGDTATQHRQAAE